MVYPLLRLKMVQNLLFATLKETRKARALTRRLRPSDQQRLTTSPRHPSPPPSPSATLCPTRPSRPLSLDAELGRGAQAGTSFVHAVRDPSLMGMLERMRDELNNDPENAKRIEMEW